VRRSRRKRNSERLSAPQLEHLQYHLEGTCQTVVQALAELDLEDHDLTIVQD